MCCEDDSMFNGSGCIMNCFDEFDSVSVIDSGNFGHRFVELCKIPKILRVVLH